MTVLFCQYARFFDDSGDSPVYGRFQNFFIGETKTYLSESYQYVPFAVGAGVGETGGDRPSTVLVCPRSDLSINIITEAVDNFWTLKVDTVILDKTDFSQLSLFLTEAWTCDGWSQNDSEGRVLSLRLSSPFDAIDTQIPPILLTEARVGSIPSPGAINVG